MTDFGIPALLEPIQNRLNAVTPGPWEWEGNDIVRTESNWTTVLESEVSCMSYCYGGSVAQVIKPEDRVFIANAPTDQARLLAAVQAVEEWCLNLDAVEKVNPSSSDNLNASAGAIANVLRKSVAAALRGEA